MENINFHTSVGGNDYPLKREIINKDLGFAIEVDGWADTWEKIKCI